jgi:hypothetical protein
VVVAPPGGDRDLTRAVRALDRLARVDHRVQEHLLQLLRVARHRGHVARHRHGGADPRFLERAAL